MDPSPNNYVLSWIVYVNIIYEAMHGWEYKSFVHNAATTPKVRIICLNLWHGSVEDCYGVLAGATGLAHMLARQRRKRMIPTWSFCWCEWTLAMATNWEQPRFHQQFDYWIYPELYDWLRILKKWERQNHSLKH
jgi:hypothetical protein